MGGNTEPYICYFCGKEISEDDCYEYRGAYSCSKKFDEMVSSRERERQEVIDEDTRITEKLKGLDMRPDTPIGKANREIFKTELEILSKESFRRKRYENRG